MKKSTVALAVVYILSISLAYAANNYRQSTSGGTVTIFKSTDTGGVHVPHVNVDTLTGITTPTGVTPTDRTITSATGSSQTLMSANAARKSLTIQNTGNANCGVNPTGGTAVIGGAGTLTLAPLGSYTPTVPTLSAVAVICTAGQPLYANES